MTPRTPAAAAIRAIADDLMEAGGLAKTDVDEACRMTVSIMGRLLAVLAIIAIEPLERMQVSEHLRVAGAIALEDDPEAPEAVSRHLYAAARLLQGVAARIEGEGDDGA